MLDIKKIIAGAFLTSLFIIAKGQDLTEKEANDMLNAEAKPVYIKASTEIATLRQEIQTAKNKPALKKQVVEHFNKTVGLTLGTLNSFDAVEKRINESGDAYVEYLFTKEKSRIALKKAAEFRYQAEKQGAKP